MVTRLRAIRRYTKSKDYGAPFPPPPSDVPEYAGPVLEDWLPPQGDEILAG